MNRSKKFFDDRLNSILREEGDPCTLEEGMMVNINKIISDTIRVPEGNYIIAVVASDHCVLVPTNEASQEKFEVFKPTLSGFFNPEIHRKTVDNTNGETILDSSS